MIPAVAHFIWIGTLEVPALGRKAMAEFADLNPDIAVRTHRCLPRSAPADVARAYWRAHWHVQMADVLRAWTLLSEGGLYFDLDHAWVRPVGELRALAPAWTASTRVTRYNNNAMGSEPGHPWMAELVRRITRNGNAALGADLKRSIHGQRTIKEMAADGVAAHVCPPHWFSAYLARSNRRLVLGTPLAERRALLEARGPWPDGVTPFAVHVRCGSPRQPEARYALGRACALLERLHGVAEPRVAEVGVWRGRMSEYLLAQSPDLRLVMVDTWAEPTAEYAASGDALAARLAAGEGEVSLRAAEERTAFAWWRRRIVRADSVAGADQVEDGSLDAAFIDACHAESAVARDCRAWWPKVRAGGWLCGHDWRAPREPRWGVAPAVLTFCAERGLPDPEVDRDLTWFVRRPA